MQSAMQEYFHDIEKKENKILDKDYPGSWWILSCHKVHLLKDFSWKPPVCNNTKKTTRYDVWSEHNASLYTDSAVYTTYSELLTIWCKV